MTKKVAAVPDGPWEWGKPNPDMITVPIKWPCPLCFHDMTPATDTAPAVCPECGYGAT